MGPKIDQEAPKCSQKLLGGILWNTLICWCVLLPSWLTLGTLLVPMPFASLLVSFSMFFHAFNTDLWSEPYKAPTRRLNYFNKSAENLPSTKLNAKYQHRELAKNFQNTANNKNTPRNSVQHFAIFEATANATNRKPQNRGRCVRRMAHRDPSPPSVPNWNSRTWQTPKPQPAPHTLPTQH